MALDLQTQIPAEIQGHERIQAHFGAALEMIDAAMDNRALPMHSTGPVSDAYATAAASAPQATSFSRSLLRHLHLFLHSHLFNRRPGLSSESKSTWHHADSTSLCSDA